MDRKKVENRLVDWSREFGFVLPDGSLPQPDLFSQLVATPNRSYLWDMILKKLISKEKVKKIRKVILAAALRADEERINKKGCLLNINTHGVEKKINLWKKKEMLEKKIIEKRKEIAELKNIIYKRAQTIQSEICKIAEIEKSNEELKEKVIISNLLSKKHKNALEHYEKEMENIKSFGIFNSLQGSAHDRDIKGKVKGIQNLILEELGRDNFNLESEGKIYSEISLLLTDKNVENKILVILLENKKDDLKKYSILDSALSNKDVEECGEEMSDELFVKLTTEQLMLDITENSLQTCLNRTCENAELAKFNEVLAKIKKIILNENIFDGSLRDISYIKPNETGDSFKAQDEKMSKIIKALLFYGLKKRRECLKHEIEKLVKENEKNEFWTSEMNRFETEISLSSDELVSLKKELARMIRMQKESAELVLKKYNELGSVINDNNYRLKEKNIFERLVHLNKEIRTGMETTIELIENMFLDGFRKVQISTLENLEDNLVECFPDLFVWDIPKVSTNFELHLKYIHYRGKEVFEFESLHHCLNHYGGEFREMFSSILLSPYDKPESILAKLEDRKSFVSYINDVLQKEKNREISHFHDAAAQDVNEELLENNYKNIEQVLSKILIRKDFLTKEIDLVKQILRSWLQQPYRYMIPDSVKLNNMTLRQYESKYQTAMEESKYYPDTNATCQF